MAKYAINSSGEASMRKLAADISRCSNDTITAYKLLKSETISIEDGLGVYATEIYEVVDKSRSSLNVSISDINLLAQRIVKKADEISELVAMGFRGKSSSDDNGNTYRVGNDLVPNSNYEINGYSYRTDEQGRIKSAEGTLHLKDREGRLTIKDTIDEVGKGDQRDGDDRGHLIGDQFDGANGLENLVPQDATINRVDFRNFEDNLASLVKSGNIVSVNVAPYYEGDSRRPSIIVVNYSVNGKNNMRVFSNE